jgi:hypothetical protein
MFIFGKLAQRPLLQRGAIRLGRTSGNREAESCHVSCYEAAVHETNAGTFNVSEDVPEG